MSVYAAQQEKKLSRRKSQNVQFKVLVQVQNYSTFIIKLQEKPSEKKKKERFDVVDFCLTCDTLEYLITNSSIL